MWTNSRPDPLLSPPSSRLPFRKRPQSSHSPARQKYDWDEFMRSQRHRGHLINFAKDTTPTCVKVPRLMLLEVALPKSETLDMDFDLKSKVMKDLELTTSRNAKLKTLSNEMRLDLNKLNEVRKGSSANSHRMQRQLGDTVRGLSSLKNKCKELKLQLKDIHPKTPTHHTRAKEFFRNVKSQKLEIVKQLLMNFPKLIIQIDSVRPNPD